LLSPVASSVTPPENAPDSAAPTVRDPRGSEESERGMGRVCILG
jgi:hypothetical protein